MKLNVLLFSLVFWSMASFAQHYSYPEESSHHIGVGPYIGYESVAQSLLGGVGAQYEFRAFPRVGLTFSTTYDRGPYASFSKVAMSHD